MSETIGGDSINWLQKWNVIEPKLIKSIKMNERTNFLVKLNHTFVRY